MGYAAAIMRSPGLVIMAAVAVAVVGYAIYTLGGSDGPAPERVSPRSAVGANDEAEPRAERAKPAGSLGVKPAPVSDASDSRRRGGPPPRPEPTVSLENARRDFQEVLDELDRVAAAGRPLTTEEWTDYYKRGNDALLPLLQHLSWGEPDDKGELQRANEDLRAKLRAIEPGVPQSGAEPAPPSP